MYFTPAITCPVLSLAVWIQKFMSNVHCHEGVGQSQGEEIEPEMDDFSIIQQELGKAGAQSRHREDFSERREAKLRRVKSSQGKPHNPRCEA